MERYLEGYLEEWIDEPTGKRYVFWTMYEGHEMITPSRDHFSWIEFLGVQFHIVNFTWVGGILQVEIIVIPLGTHSAGSPGEGVSVEIITSS